MIFCCCGPLYIPVYSRSIYSSTASIAQHSAITPDKAANQVRADQSATTARKQTELARASKSCCAVPGCAFSFVVIKKSICVRTCMRRPGCFPGAWSSWHLQVAWLHLKCWTIYHIWRSVPFFLSERSGRKRPLREVPCISYFRIYGLRRTAATQGKKINTCDSNTRARIILVKDSLSTVFAFLEALSSLVDMM